MRHTIRASVFLAGLIPCLLAAGAHAFPEFETRPIEAQAVAYASPDAFETYLDRLMRAESGGRDDAANPRSSALGPFQFIKSTFLDIARRHFAIETDELSENEVLKLRVNRTFARRAAALYTRESLAALSAQGLIPTFGHMRLAYLVGPAAAARLIRALPSTPASDVLGAAVVKANPFMNRMSASELVARAARDISDDRNSLVAAAPAPRDRPIAMQPAARQAPRPSEAGTGARQQSATVAAPCNTRLVACRRWVFLHQKQANRPADDRDLRRRDSKRSRT